MGSGNSGSFNPLTPGFKDINLPAAGWFSDIFVELPLEILVTKRVDKSFPPNAGQVGFWNGRAMDLSSWPFGL